MRKEEKQAIIADLTEKFKQYNCLYIADTTSIPANATNSFRRELHKSGVKMEVAKNTLIKRAMIESGKDFGDMLNILSGTSALLFSENMKAPAQAIIKFRGKGTKPVLKGAYVDTAVYIGDNQLAALSTLKSKEDLIADVIAMLQTPARNVISALQSSGGKLAGIVKTLSEK